MNHPTLAQRASQDLAQLFDGVSYVILYGSVARGTHRPESDIDLAVILDDSMKLFPLDDEGVPFGYR